MNNQQGKTVVKTLFKWVGVLGMAGVLSACGGGSNDAVVTPAKLGNIAEVAQKNNFTALLAAVDKAGIASTLTSPSANLTVFAPKGAGTTRRIERGVSIPAQRDR
ncbi:MAG: hypothetical protein IPN06_15130 [Burkholderiales bacterium]|nr:hypothetical protein [Burkholderiales bacterium]